MTKNAKGKKQQSKKAAKPANLKITVQAPKSQKGKRRGKGRPNPRMSECASKFLASVREPFSTHAMNCCLPYPPDRDSMKVQGYARFVLTTDASGIGWVQVAPTLANDAYSIYYSATTTTVPFVASAGTPVPAGVSGTFFNLPFSVTTLTTPGLLEGRVVSVGFRVTYIGTVSDMAGTYFAYSDPAHINVNQANCAMSGAGVITSALETKIRRVTDKPFEMGFTVVKDEEHKYSSVVDYRLYTGQSSTLCAFPWSGGLDINTKGPADAGYLPNQGATALIFGVLNAKAGTTFYIELIEHVEYTGKSASFGLTPSHNDHNAANLVTAAADRATAEYTAQPQSSWASTVSKTFSDVASELSGHMATPMGKLALSAAARAGRTYLGRRSGAFRQVQ